MPQPTTTLLRLRSFAGVTSRRPSASKSTRSMLQPEPGLPLDTFKVASARPYAGTKDARRNPEGAKERLKSLIVSAQTCSAPLKATSQLRKSSDEIACGSILRLHRSNAKLGPPECVPR